MEAQIGEILRTPSLDRNLLVLIKKECNVFSRHENAKIEILEIERKLNMHVVLKLLGPQSKKLLNYILTF